MERKYTLDQQSTDVPFTVEAGYNSVTIVNKGTGIARVEGYPLAVNEVYSISGNLGEVSTKALKISFDPGATNLVYIIRKIYK